MYVVSDAADFAGFEGSCLLAVESLSTGNLLYSSGYVVDTDREY